MLDWCLVITISNDVRCNMFGKKTVSVLLSEILLSGFYVTSIYYIIYKTTPIYRR
jgi:hypothetical protein